MHGRCWRLLFGAMVLGGCGRTLVEGVSDGCDPAHSVCTVSLSLRRAADVLFVIDNSGSMAEEQATLAQNFSAFVEQLERNDLGANYRIGVTTTDIGNFHCSATGDLGALRATSCRSRLHEFQSTAGGQFQDKAAEGCLSICAHDSISLRPTPTELDPTPRVRPWLEKDGGTTNLPSGVTMEEALQCLGPQGIDGCGFEAHLESMMMTLDRSDTPDDPAWGFIRDDSVLAVVFVTDEVDCSSPTPFGEPFAGNQAFWSGFEPDSGICWRAGVACSGGPGVYTECHAQDKDAFGNETTKPDEAVLHSIDRYIERLQEVAAAPNGFDRPVVVALLGGVPAGYPGTPIVYQDPVNPSSGTDQFGVEPGCRSEAGIAIPPVRIREVAEAFETGQSNIFSVCEPDYSAALAAIADTIGDVAPRGCFPGCVMDQDPSTPEVDAGCNVRERTPTPDGGVILETVPECRVVGEEWDFPTPSADVCFRPMGDADGSTPWLDDDVSQGCLGQGFNVEMVLHRRPGAEVPPGTTVEVTCATSPKNYECR